MADGAPGNAVTPFAFGGGLGGSDDGEHDRVQTLVDLPAPVRGRVAALRKLQIDSLVVEADFYRRVHQLEMEFATRFDALHQKREKIVNAVEEPSDEEKNYPLFSEEETELADKFKQALDVAQPNSADNEIKGIPDFWLTVLQNVEVTRDMIQEADEEVMKHLKDIKVRLSDSPMSFTLEFHFGENAHFTNSVLTKEYTLKCEPDMKDPADFDGPEIVLGKGCAIDWKDGKNITVKLVKKKQKNKKQAGQTRFVTKQVKADSFFNFFDPPAHTGGMEDQAMSEEDRMLLHCDFEIGQTIRDTIIPHALFHFTGEAAEFDDDDFDDEDEDMSDEDSDGDDE